MLTSQHNFKTLYFLNVLTKRVLILLVFKKFWENFRLNNKPPLWTSIHSYTVPKHKMLGNVQIKAVITLV